MFKNISHARCKSKNCTKNGDLTRRALHSCLREVCSKPRTLKQMARVVIYNAVGQRPAIEVNKLPLPTALREYLLNFEP